MASPATDRSWDTPSIQASTAIMVCHSTTRIAAPASLVFRTLRNTDTWKDWCHMVPKVVISYQPPEQDETTATEIQELVRNTSIAGSYNSDLTDGLVGGGVNRYKDSPAPDMPPLKLRSKSDASRQSTGRSNSEGDEDSVARQQSVSSYRSATANGNEPRLSAAQKYAAAQASRRSSVQAGEEPPAVTGNTLVNDPFLSTDYTSSPSQRRKSQRAANADAAIARAKHQSSLTALKLYGEPSVRVQINTKLTFFVRMNPNNDNEFKQTHMVVTEVSRPDDPVSDGSNLTALTRTKTHTLSRTGVYRIVWAMDSSKSSLSSMKNGTAYPKSLLQTERVQEIRPIILGDGSEECEYTTWECQRGPLAKVVKKKYGDYIESQLARWGVGLGQFCEAMGGKVDRRDFILEAETGDNSRYTEVQVFSTAALG